MMTQTTTDPAISQVQAEQRQSAQRGRKAQKQRNRGQKISLDQRNASAQHSEIPVAEPVAPKVETTSEVPNGDEEDDSAVCWICAEPVKYYSVSECNHRTCHVCALRLRALYKKLDCTFCKHPQTLVIFTQSPDGLFAEYGPERIPFKDVKLSIAFETQDMMEETLILLRFNCPDPECDYIASGWSDLKVHARGMHGKMMCDLCIRSKKVFAHEHALYPPNILYQHLPSLPHRPVKPVPKDKIDGGVHPICEFCRDCYFSDDELFSHLRERHEECFVCKRNGVRDQYFRNYDQLEQHFTNGHFPCTHPSCLVQKFVVFGTAMDLQAHMVEEHGATMSSKDKKEIRKVVAEFEFEEVGGSSNDRRRRRDRDRDRDHEPPPSAPPPQQPRAVNKRREGFGATLTADSGPPSGSNTPPTQQAMSRRQSPSPSRENADPMVLERQAAFAARLNAATSGSSSSTAAIKAAIRSYRMSESPPRDLISTIFNALERDLEATAGLIVSLVDLLEAEDKRRDLLAAWNGFKIEQRREFPDLVPMAVGSAYAGVAAGRVLNVKHSTGSRSSQQSTRQVWDRVARAAASSAGAAPAAGPSARSADRYPALQPPSSAVTPMFRQASHVTPWASSSSASKQTTPASTRPEPLTKKGKVAPPQLSNSAFPTLPSSNARPKPAVGGNQSLRNIVGNTAPSTVAWGSSPRPGESDAGGVNQSDPAADAAPDPAHAKGKKKKGKEKQTLFTLGSFPT